MNFDSITYAIIAIAVLVVIFLAIRNLILWYYKINEGIKVLEEIREELKKLNAK